MRCDSGLARMLPVAFCRRFALGKTPPNAFICIQAWQRTCRGAFINTNESKRSYTYLMLFTIAGSYRSRASYELPSSAAVYPPARSPAQLTPWRDPRVRQTRVAVPGPRRRRRISPVPKLGTSSIYGPRCIAIQSTNRSICLLMSRMALRAAVHSAPCSLSRPALLVSTVAS